MKICLALVLSVSLARAISAELPKLSIPFSFIEKNLRAGVHQKDVLKDLAEKVKNESDGEATASGILFLGVVPELSVDNGVVVPVVSAYAAVKISGKANNNGYLMSRTVVQFKLNNGAIETKVTTDAADIRTSGPGFLDIGNREGQMREKLCKNLNEIVSPKIKTAIDQKLNAMATLPVASIVLNKKEIRLTFGERGNGYSEKDEIPYGPVPFSEIKGEFIPRGATKRDAALIVSIFCDHLWFYAATLHQTGVGDPINDGRHETLNKRIAEEKHASGRHRLVMYLPDGYVNNNLDRDWLLNQNWNDHIRVISVRPGPRYSGQKMVLYENQNQQGRELRLNVGDYPLHLDKYGLGDRVSSFLVK